MSFKVIGIPGNKSAPSGIEGVTVRSDVPYSVNTEKRRTVDIISSDEVFGPLPVIVYFSYGTLAKYARTTGLELCKSFAKRGLVAVNADIGTLGEGGGLKDVLADINELLLWIGSSAEEYRFDLEHVYAAGTFRGTMAAVWASMICNGGSIRKIVDAEAFPNFEIKGLGLFTPVYRRKDLDIKQRAMFKRISEAHPDWNGLLFPETAIPSERLPPVLLATCTRGPEHRSAEAYKAALDSAGIPNDLLLFRGLSVGFTERDSSSPESVRTVSRMLKMFLDR